MDHREVKRLGEKLAKKIWREVGKAATEQRAAEAAYADVVLHKGFALLATGELALTADDLLRAAQFMHEIEVAAKQQEYEDRMGQWRLDRMTSDLVRVFEIVGEVAGDSVRNEVVRRACADDQTKYTMVYPAFAQVCRAVDKEDWERRIAERDRTARARPARRVPRIPASYATPI